MKMKMTLLAAALCCGLFTTGCTMDKPQGKVLSITSRGLLIECATTGSTTGTPDVKMIIGSQTVTILPTSESNVVHAADFSDSSTVSQNVNPFNASGTETLAAGGYRTTQGTNNLAEPGVPR